MRREAALPERIWGYMEQVAQLGVEDDDGGMQSRALEVMATRQPEHATVEQRARQMRYVLGADLYDALFAMVREEA